MCSFKRSVENISWSSMFPVLSAIGIATDGRKPPTSAGLLMFSNEYDIVHSMRTFGTIRSSMMPIHAGLI